MRKERTELPGMMFALEDNPGIDLWNVWGRALKSIIGGLIQWDFSSVRSRVWKTLMVAAAIWKILYINLRFVLRNFRCEWNVSRIRVTMMRSIVGRLGRWQWMAGYVNQRRLVPSLKGISVKRKTYFRENDFVVVTDLKIVTNSVVSD